MWYKEGLRFKCTGCGKCCTGSPGVVWVSEKEAEDIANFLDITLHQFKRDYTKLVGENKRVLREIGKEWDCVCLKDKKCCTIYPCRPKQCRTFPWWKGVLSSKEAWEQAKEYCEGIDHPEGRLYSPSEIQKLSEES